MNKRNLYSNLRLF